MLLMMLALIEQARVMLGIVRQSSLCEFTQWLHFSAHQVYTHSPQTTRQDNPVFITFMQRVVLKATSLPVLSCSVYHRPYSLVSSE